MEVLGLVASPRRDGNTADMTNHALEWLQKKRIKTQMHNLFDFDITPCGVKCKVDCYEIVSPTQRFCPVDNQDELSKLVEIIRKADGVILATPCYGFTIPAHLKAFIERSDLKEFNDKGVGIIAIASLGGIHMVSTITSNLIHNTNATIVGWAILTWFYPKKGQAIKDENNKKSVEKLAERMYLALKNRQKKQASFIKS